MPRWLKWTIALGATVALVPFACVARARVIKTPKPRIHIIQDMDNQPRYEAQQANPLFADGRAMRRPIEGTVARGMLFEADHLYRGIVEGAWAGRPPMPVTLDVVQRGRERYEIFCAPCHGLTGQGDGMVAIRADALQEGTWVPPASFHVEPALTREDGHIFNTITNGIRNMPAYGRQIPAEDRWAIVTYVRALQRSQATRPPDAGESVRSAPR